MGEPTRRDVQPAFDTHKLYLRGSGGGRLLNDHPGRATVLFSMLLVAGTLNAKGAAMKPRIVFHTIAVLLLLAVIVAM
jgi:hypothetical protein